MNAFFKTTAGKIILFCVCVIMAAIFLVSVVSAVLIMKDDFYTSTPVSTIWKYIDGAEKTANSIIWQYLFYDAEYRETTYKLIDKDGNIVSEYDKPDCTGVFCSVEAIVNRTEQGKPYDISLVYDNDSGMGTEVYTLEFYIPDSFNVRTVEFVINTLYSLRTAVYYIGAAAFALALASFIALCLNAGHKNGCNELVPGVFDRVPYDIIFIAGTGIACFLIAITGELFVGNRNIPLIIRMVVIAGMLVTDLAIALELFLDMVIRIKRHTLIKTSFTYRFCFFCIRTIMKPVRFIRHMVIDIAANLPLVIKAAAAAGIAVAVDLLLAADAELFGILVVEKLLLFAAFMYGALMLKRLQLGAAALARGELDARIDTERMLLDFKKSGEDLNNINSGISAAVSERIKSERMKVELITNVSHDIKTPLTSIINYASLIKEEKCDNERINEYSGILVRNSERLKRLLSDLVEATKADTGNLDITLAQCSASVLLAQTCGEYADRLENAGLTLVQSQPDDEIYIMADGRRMSRIFDNLLGNICKYSMPGTRVYLGLNQSGTEAVFSFKNTSRDELNISSDELMERFVRGDTSRNTEGSGLGLAIARSLTELQGGKLALTVDGDLFKAELSFPIVHK